MTRSLCIGIIVNSDLPIEKLLTTLSTLTYPKEATYIAFYVAPNYFQHEKIFNFQVKFIEQYANIYIKCFKTLKPFDYYAILDVKMLDVDYYLRWENGYVVDNPALIEMLTSAEKPIISPMMARNNMLWSNFWGATDENGYYARSDDYVEIVNRDKVGTFNVPYITGIYLIAKDVWLTTDNLENCYCSPNNVDSDMYFCQNLSGSLWVDNVEEYGYIDIPEAVREVSLFDYENCPYQWAAKYLVTTSSEVTSPLGEVTSPTTDVYVCSLFSEAFCREVIELVDLWSGSISDDERVGGYENHPTDDIHLYQLGLDQMWAYVHHNYIGPIVRECYNNYISDDINISFVVRYSMNGQRELEPHHDASTYTVNVALNSPDEYEGGGCRFIRQEYDHIDIPQGSITIHPGRLTHYHQGLEITSGTRYLLVSFVK